jgi:hypothetical protein
MPATRAWTDSDFVAAVRSSRSIRKVLQALGLSPTGANDRTVYSHLDRFRLSFDHFLGQGHLRGGTHIWAPRKPLAAICVADSCCTNISYLKNDGFWASVYFRYGAISAVSPPGVVSLSHWYWIISTASTTIIVGKTSDCSVPTATLNRKHSQAETKGGGAGLSGSGMPPGVRPPDGPRGRERRKTDGNRWSC